VRSVIVSAAHLEGLTDPRPAEVVDWLDALPLESV